MSDAFPERSVSAVRGERFRKFFGGKRVLVTGAAGSVGSALAARLATLGCESLALLDHFDHGLLDVCETVQRAAPNTEVRDVLCDIRDRERLNACLGRVKPDIVIHAAALKHVHMGDRHPGECVLTNLVGVHTTLAASVAAGASDFMLVSSDKAASPVCVMGATKRLAELHLAGFEAERRPATRVRSVRFGNILGSQGSVVPRFAAQIAAGGPLEITHAEMVRYFMTVDEAVGLILNVTALEDSDAPSSAGYYMDMGEPVSILQLGRDMIAKSGKDIEIVFTGVREGEKIREELFDEYEVAQETALESVYRVVPQSPDALVTTADIERLDRLARTAPDALITQHVFAELDRHLGREEPAVG